MAKAAVLKKESTKLAKKSARPAQRPAAAKVRPQLKVVKAAPAAPVRAKAASKPSVAKKTQVKSSVKAPAKAPAAVKAPVRKEAPKKSASRRDFRVGDHVVYPTHGVGRIVAEETQTIGGVPLMMLVISFEKDRMTLRVPVQRAVPAGLRHISGSDQMSLVFTTLKSRARVSRGMWSRRAQEYETKINSGNIIAIAEVVRDLHPNVDQAERSYSERMIYESALSRLVGELAAAESSDQKVAMDKLMKLLRAKIAA